MFEDAGTALVVSDDHPGVDEFDEAQAYTDLCLAVLALGTAHDRQEVRDWWTEAADDRTCLCLSKAQEKAILDACRAAAVNLPEPSRKTSQRRPR